MPRKSSRLKEEFQWQNFRLAYEYPDDFVLPHWQISSLIDPFYVTYRCLFLLTFVAMAYGSLRWTSRVPISITIRSLAFFTIWGYFLCLVDAVLAFYMVVRVHVKQTAENSSEIPDFPVLCRVYWVIQNVTTEVNVGIAVGYWCFVHFNEVLYRANIAMHIWNSGLVLMDFFIVSVPVKIYHVYFSLILGLIYSVFSYIYYVAGGLRVDGKHCMYKMLDWRDHPIRAGCMCLLSLIILVMVRFMLFGLFRLRVWIFYNCYDEQHVTETTRRGFVL